MDKDTPVLRSPLPVSPFSHELISVPEPLGAFMTQCMIPFTPIDFSFQDLFIDVCICVCAYMYAVCHEGQRVSGGLLSPSSMSFKALYLPKLGTYIFSACLEAGKPQLGAGAAGA